MARSGVAVVDSAPVECGRSREAVKRSGLASWAEYGYCAGEPLGSNIGLAHAG